MTTLRARPVAASFLAAVALSALAAGYLWLGPPLRAAADAAAAPPLRALALGALAAAATAGGALAAFALRGATMRFADALLGFGAGVMLAATAFSLVLPALDAAGALGATPLAAALLVGLGIALGAAAVHGLDRVLPHEHFVKGVEGAALARRVRRVWLFVAAIAIHNIPEGMAIGVGAAGLGPAEATALAAGIAIQDIPEGLVPVVALAAIGYRMPVAALIGAASGLVEPVAAVAAAVIVGLSSALLPLALGMTGGAMLFVVSHEVIPESHRNDRGGHATAALIAGFVLMMILDTALGR
jgi:ZIP family zinc transporter